MLPRAGQQSSGPSQGLPSNSMAPMHFIKVVKVTGFAAAPSFRPPIATALRAGHHGAQRHKKTGEALMGDDGTTPLPLTSHTLAPVPVAIGGRGLPASIVFRDDLPAAGLANITGVVLLQCAALPAAPSPSPPHTPVMPAAPPCKLVRACRLPLPCHVAYKKASR